jgi:hypothetical protein
MRKAVAINEKRLVELCHQIRQLSQLTPTERRDTLEILLKEIDILRVAHVENLLCIRHTMELRKYKNHSSVYRIVERRNDLHVFKICCRDYFSREELVKQPGIRPHRTGTEKKVKVGMGGAK